MSLKEEVVANLRAALISCNGLLPVKACNRDYKELTGEWIPYEKLGYRSVKDLFENIPGFRVTCGSDGEFMVGVIPDEASRNIAQLISRQKSSKKSSHRLSHPPRRLKPNSWQKFPRAAIPPKTLNMTPRNTFQRAPVSTRSPTTPRPNMKITLEALPNNIARGKPPKRTITVTNDSPRTTETSPNFRPNDSRSREISSNFRPNDSKSKEISPNFRPNDSKSKEMSPNFRPNDTKSKEISPNLRLNDTKTKETSPSFKQSDFFTNIIGSKTSNTSSFMKKPEGPKKFEEQRILPEKIHSSASDRMNALRTNLQNTPESVDVAAAEDLREKIMKLSIDTNFKENKSRLIELCKLMKLPEPVIKTCENKSKGHYPSTFDCSVKIGTEYSFSTYPDSLKSCDLAIETAASKALEKLHTIALESNAKPTTSTLIALERIIKIVTEHPNGLWANGLSDIYEQKYQEMLPANWLNLIGTSSQVEIEKASGLQMLLPASSNPKTLLSSSSSTSSIGNDDIRALATTDTSLEDNYPPQLQYPEESHWNVFIMSASSTVEIWLRIIGEQYSDAFEVLNNDMESYFNNVSNPSANVVKGGWYAIKSEDGWFRTRVLDIDYVSNIALCFLVDTGDEENHPFGSLFELPQQFLTVAPQAISCCLAGLEEYSSIPKFGKYTLSEILVGKGLIAEIIQVPDDSFCGDDPTISIVLYDTSTNQDLNLNKDLLHQLTHEAKPPELSYGITEIYVSEMTSNGTIFAQIHNESWRLLQKMLQQVVDGPFPKEALQASCSPLLPKPNVYYLAKSAAGDWKRAVLHGNLINSPDGETFLNVKYIDYGYMEKVLVENLLPMERLSDALNFFPVQVMKLSLHNVSYLNQDNLRRLKELIPKNVPVLCKQVLLGSNKVEIFVRTQPNNILCSVNNAINMEIELTKKIDMEPPRSDSTKDWQKKKERIFPNFNNNTSDVTIPKFQPPKNGSLFNVFVSLAANPSNFTIQPLESQSDLNQLMQDLQSVGGSPSLSTVPMVGAAYAAYYKEDGSWYRAFVQGIVSQELASVYFCDYGDLKMVEICKLRELPATFKMLPAQALKARLHGVSPINKDWSVEDCLRFKELVVERHFVSIVENIEPDPFYKSEYLLTLNLIDTSTENDIHINKILCKEGRAKLV